MNKYEEVEDKNTKHMKEYQMKELDKILNKNMLKVIKKSGMNPYYKLYLKTDRKRTWINTGAGAFLPHKIFIDVYRGKHDPKDPNAWGEGFFIKRLVIRATKKSQKLFDYELDIEHDSRKEKTPDMNMNELKSAFDTSMKEYADKMIKNKKLLNDRINQRGSSEESGKKYDYDWKSYNKMFYENYFPY